MFSSHSDEPVDFVSVILKCHKEAFPWKELLNYNIEMSNPGYCIIAATYPVSVSSYYVTMFII